MRQVRQRLQVGRARGVAVQEGRQRPAREDTRRALLDIVLDAQLDRQRAAGAEKGRKQLGQAGGTGGGREIGRAGGRGCGGLRRNGRECGFASGCRFFGRCRSTGGSCFVGQCCFTGGSCLGRGGWHCRRRGFCGHGRFGPCRIARCGRRGSRLGLRRRVGRSGLGGVGQIGHGRRATGGIRHCDGSAHAPGGRHVLQIGGLVDVRHGRQFGVVQAGGRQALARIGHHPRGTPGQAGEQAAQPGCPATQADQRIAAVEGRHDDGIVQAQRSGGVAQHGRVQRRDVGAHQQQRPGVGPPRGFEDMCHARTEVALALRPQFQAMPAGQPPEGRVRGVGCRPDRHRPHLGGHRLGRRVHQQPLGQRRGARRAQRGYQPRLGIPGQRRLGQHGDAAAHTHR